ncbi:MAG: glycoside hydrolase family 127 protein [Bacteroidales bacterium]|nr:glycoside hydrolase family 127 protein [Bacteroidales bacterium]
MNKKLIFTGLFCLLMPCSILAQDKLYCDEFPLSDITLLDGPLKHARDLNVENLKKYDCDRMLAPYRKEAGLEPRKPTYPNWDGLDGHVGGHYLSALAINAATGSEECRRRMEYMIGELKLCAEANDKRGAAWSKNYVGGFPQSEKLWSTFRTGDFAQYFGSWAPFYNLHKMYAGLRDAWLYCGNEDARQLFLKFCDWAVDITSKLSDEQMERMLGNEHGGMDEVIADAYAMTGDQRYLDCARRFAHRQLLTPMENHQDCLDNMHANTQIPKVIGFQRIAELSGDAKWHDASQYFWEIVTQQRSLAIGGNSRREHFPTKETCIDYVNDIDGPESCNTYNMLKLTEFLNRANPNAAYGNFYERAMFNHILSTQHPEHGGYVYFTSARPRHYRNYSAPNMAMWCCVGTGMENHGKYGQWAWTRKKGEKPSDDVLYVNLFVASELNWRDRGITIRQETAFPYGETSEIAVTKGKGVFTLKIRKPAWCDKFEIKCVGFEAEQYEENGFVCISRKWKRGDRIAISMPMHASVERMPNVPQYVTIMYGPIVLGMKTGTEDMSSLIADDSRFGQYAGGKKLPLDKAPILLPKEVSDIAGDLRPVTGKPLHFTLATRMENAIPNGELQPFFEIHDSRYMMYWLALSETDYKAYTQRLADEESARQALEAATVDKVMPGEQQPETDHRMETDNSEKGSTEGVFYRDARDGSYFSYLMQTKGETDLSLQLTFWGQDEWRTSEFDIYIDDALLTSVNNSHRWRTTQFKTVDYPLPASMLEGKNEVRVKFVAHKGRQVGQIYGVRLKRN